MTIDLWEILLAVSRPALGVAAASSIVSPLLTAWPVSAPSVQAVFACALSRSPAPSSIWKPAAPVSASPVLAVVALANPVHPAIAAVVPLSEPVLSHWSDLTILLLFLFFVRSLKQVWNFEWLDDWGDIVDVDPLLFGLGLSSLGEAENGNESKENKIALHFDFSQGRMIMMYLTTATFISESPYCQMYIFLYLIHKTIKDNVAIIRKNGQNFWYTVDSDR